MKWKCFPETEYIKLRDSCRSSRDYQICAGDFLPINEMCNGECPEGRKKCGNECLENTVTDRFECNGSCQQTKKTCNGMCTEVSWSVLSLYTFGSEPDQ